MLRDEDTIRLLVPVLPTAIALLPYLKEIDQARHYTNFGPLCQMLEARLQVLTGAAHVVCVSSGTLGLEIALAALNLKPGSKIALPSLTFPATGTAIVRSGHQPVFCDVDPTSCLLTPEILTAALQQHNIAAVIPVSLFGRSQDCARWEYFSKTFGIPVIFDSAGAIGYQPIGESSITVFSLHATKPLASAEGGFVATSDPKFAAALRSLSNFGFVNGGIQAVGTNGKLSEYHSAIGLSALDTWPERCQALQLIFATYLQEFKRSGTDRVATIVNSSAISGTLTIKTRRDITTEDQANLHVLGIETRRWYWPPLHNHAAFATCARATSLPTTDFITGQLLGIPYHANLSHRQISRVARAIAETFL